MILGERRQQNGPERRAEHSGREFHQAVGVIQPGHAAGAEEGGKNGVDQEADLRHRNAEHGRGHQPENAAYPLVFPVEGKARQHANAPQERQLQGKLQCPAKKHRPAQRQHRPRKTGGGKQCHADEAEIEQHRREGRNGKTAPGVENAARQGDQRHEQDVGEGDAGEFDRQRKLVGVGGKAGCGKINQQRRADHAEQSHQEQHQKEQGGDPVDQPPGFILAALVLVFPENRHEGL